MIALERLQQIIPADQALANKALSLSLQQINGIKNLNLPVLATAINGIQTTKDLPLITALTQAVPPTVADYYESTLADGSGPNGTLRVVDVLGSVAGWISTDAFTQVVEIFSTMNLTTLTTIYQRMTNSLDGSYGPIDSGPIVIPPGPAAGTYVGTDISTPPDPPEYDPTAISLAMTALRSAAAVEIANLQSTYPTECTELNTLFTNMCIQVTNEDDFQTQLNIDYDNFTANDRNSIYSFIFSLPDYGLQKEVGGMAWFVETMADLTTQGGQAIVGVLRQGQNQQVLNRIGIQTNSGIPADPNPPPPEAELIPSEYTEEEAAMLVIK